MHPTRRILLLFAPAFCALAIAPAGFSTTLTPTESAFVLAVNATRTAHGLRPLQIGAGLTLAARFHSSEMLHGNYFSHGDFAGRMADFHVDAPLLGENLAWGTGRYAQAPAMISEWLRSPGHRANLLRPGFARIGIGIARGRFLGNKGAVVLTADFAGP